MAWILGSVAERVVSRATVPLLLLRVIAMKPPVSKENFMFKTFGPDQDLLRACNRRKAIALAKAVSRFKE